MFKHLSAGPEHYARQLIKISKVQGEFEHIGEDCKIDDWEAKWWARFPPSKPDDPDERWQQMLQEYGWVDQQSKLVRPEVGMHADSERNE